MKQLSYKKILAVLFSAVIFFFFFTICERVFRFTVLHQTPETIAAETQTENETAGSSEKWKALFPFAEGTEPVKETPAEETEEPQLSDDAQSWDVFPRLSLKKKIVFLNKYLQINVGYYTEKLLFARMQMIHLYGRFNKAIGLTMLTNSDDHIAVMRDGSLTSIRPACDAADVADRIVDFADALEADGKQFLYVQVPSKVDPDNNLLPAGVEDTGNPVADTVVSRMKESGTDYLDLRQSMHEQGISFSDAYFKTDHHWKIETALWASGEIMKKAAETGVKIDTSKFNIEDYTVKVFKKFALGSLGKRVTLAFADPEDFSVVLPNFETDVTLKNYLKNEKRGTFEDTLVNMHVFDKVDYYNVSAYGAYLYQNSALLSIENHKAANNTRLLVIGDSFSLSTVPYMALGVKTIYRLEKVNFDGSVQTLLKEIDPDLVIVMFYPATYNNASDAVTFE